MHIHILGIAGTFMGGVAAIARQAGYKVTGCDTAMYPPMSHQINELDIEYYEGFSADQLKLGADLYVVGNIVGRGRQDNGDLKFPLMEAILTQRLPYISGPQWLAENILRPIHKRPQHVIAIAGTHGKTTTTSMVAWILEKAGKTPNYLIGGRAKNFTYTGRYTEKGADIFVIEADEYDCAFFDKRSKFIHYRPDTLIINNIEFDHADIFPDIQAIYSQFHNLIRTMSMDARLLVPADDRNVLQVLKQGYWSDIQYFGMHPHKGWWIQPISSTECKVFLDDQEIVTISPKVLGSHNQLNALVAILACHHIGVPFATSKYALEEFQGVSRRMEVVIRRDDLNLTIFDDFAHHPTAIEKTIEGLKNQLTSSERILVLLELRSNTMKLGAMRKCLPHSLRLAEKVFVSAYGISWDVEQTFSEISSKCRVLHSYNELVDALMDEIRPGDRVICMSNGSFGNILQTIVQKLPEKFPPLPSIH